MKIKTNIIEKEFRNDAGEKNRQDQEKSIALVLTLKLGDQFHSFLTIKLSYASHIISFPSVP